MTVLAPQCAQDRSIWLTRLIRWGPWLAVGAMMLLAMAISVPPAICRPLWGDEIRTWFGSICRSYHELLTWTHNSHHAPLGHLLARISCDVFHTDTGWAMRLPSLVCGILCIPAIFLLGRVVASTAVGLLSAMLATVDLNLVWQTQQARMYTILLLMSVLALLAGNRAMHAPKRPWLAWGVAGLLLGAALWVHFSAFAIWFSLLVGAATLAIVKLWRRERWGGCWAIIGAVIAIAIAAAVAIQGIQKISHLSTPPEREKSIDHRLNEVKVAVRDIGGELHYLPFLAAGVGLLLLWRRNPGMATTLACLAAISVLNLWLASKYRPVRGGRYLTILQPTLWIGASCLAMWMLSLRHRGLTVLVIIGLVGIIAVSAIRAVQAEDVSSGYASYRNRYAFAQAMAVVRSRMRPDDTVIYAAFPSFVHERFGDYFGVPGTVTIARRVHRDRDDDLRGRPIDRIERDDFNSRYTWIIGSTPVPEGMVGTVEDPQAVLDRVARKYQLSRAQLRIPKPDQPDGRQFLVIMVTREKVRKWQFPLPPLRSGASDDGAGDAEEQGE